jgi:hypothetical protein
MFLHPRLVNFCECATRCLFGLRGLLAFLAQQGVAQSIKVGDPLCPLISRRLFKHVQKFRGQRNGIARPHVQPPSVHNLLGKSIHALYRVFEGGHGPIIYRADSFSWDLRPRNFHFHVAAGCGVIDGGHDLRHVRFHQTPASFSQNYNRNLAALQVLLVRKVPVGRDQHLKPCGLGLRQQLSVFEFFPSTARASVTAW